MLEELALRFPREWDPKIYKLSEYLLKFHLGKEEEKQITEEEKQKAREEMMRRTKLTMGAMLGVGTEA